MGKVQILVPIAPTIPSPTAVHNAVPMRETERYPRDVAVSGMKQSFGMTALISFDKGKSSGERERAFPFSPYFTSFHANVN